MEYNRTYKEADVKELYKWFDEQHYDNAVELGHGIDVKDVKMLVDCSRSVALAKYDNPTYSGQIHFLFMVREALINQGKVKDSL